MEKRIAILESRYYKHTFFEKKLSEKAQVMRDVFFIYAFYDEDLPARICDYILKGDELDPLKYRELLDTLRLTPPEKFPISLRTVRLYGECPELAQQHFEKQLLENILRRSFTAREQIFKQWTDFLTMAELIRFGKVLSVLPEYSTELSERVSEVPQWLVSLIQHAAEKYQRFETVDFQENRKKITLESLADLLEEVHLERALVFDLLIDPKTQAAGVNFYEVYFYLTKTVGFETILLEHQDMLLEQFKRHKDVHVYFRQVIVIEAIPALLPKFQDYLISLCVVGGSELRKRINPLLSTLDDAYIVERLNSFLIEGDAPERKVAAELMGIYPGAKPYLEQALESERGKAIRKQIETSLATLIYVHNVAENHQDYQLEVPVFTPAEIAPISLSELKSLFKTNLEILLTTIKEKIELEQKRQEGDHHSYLQWCQGQHQSLLQIAQLTDDDVLEIGYFLNGEREIQDPTIVSLYEKIGEAHIREILSLFFYQKRIFNLTNFSYFHALRIKRFALLKTEYIASIFPYPELCLNKDLRQIEHEIKASQINAAPERLIAEEYLSNSVWSSLARVVKGDNVWPFFITHFDFIREGLGQIPSQEKFGQGLFTSQQTLAVIHLMPTIPQVLLPHLLMLALAESGHNRLLAQEILSRVPKIHLRIEEALDSGKQTLRRSAVEWLIRLKSTESISALYQRLKREKQAVVRATILTALESFGEDISYYLTPEFLLEEAKKGLAGTLPVSFSWFSRDVLPRCYWRDGEVVAEDIIYYWLILAVKLNTPGGNALFQRYLSRLDDKSQQQLGAILLQCFIEQDTISPTIEDALKIAQKEAPKRLLQYHAMANSYPDEAWSAAYRDATLEGVISEIQREEQAKYLGSAIKDKGMLAFVYAMNPSAAISIVKQFMREHPSRRAQIMALIEAFSQSNDPLMVQFILSIARHHRISLVQELAQSLVTKIAQRNGWGHDELADKTIPTAGLNDAGVMSLSYGERSFTAKLNARLTVSLYTSENEEIKALPVGRKTEDAALVKESRKYFSDNKKALKQVVTFQSRRLFESMCAQRSWRVDEWKRYYYEHPIMRHLISRLIWVNTQEDGKIITLFRPVDGVLLDVEGEEVTLMACSHISLAHGVLLDENSLVAWKKHLKEHKIKALFPQLDHTTPAVKVIYNDEILDRKGWMTETFTLRNIMQKLGYVRGICEEGNFFDYYSKYFEALDCHIIIRFSGNEIPEENLPAALIGLCYQRSLLWSEDAIDLEKVPPILIAEGYSDYLKVAKACEGYEADWQKRVPW